MSVNNLAAFSQKQNSRQISKCEITIIIVWLALNDVYANGFFFFKSLFLSFSPPPAPNYTECWMIDGGCILSAPPPPPPRPGTIKPARTAPYTETPILSRV